MTEYPPYHPGIPRLFSGNLEKEDKEWWAELQASPAGMNLLVYGDGVGAGRYENPFEVYPGVAELDLFMSIEDIMSRVRQGHISPDLLAWKAWARDQIRNEFLRSMDEKVVPDNTFIRRLLTTEYPAILTTWPKYSSAIQETVTRGDAGVAGQTRGLYNLLVDPLTHPQTTVPATIGAWYGPQTARKRSRSRLVLKHLTAEYTRHRQWLEFRRDNGYQGQSAT